MKIKNSVYWYYFKLDFFFENQKLTPLFDKIK